MVNRHYTVTLTSAGTVYNLDTLIKAIQSKEGSYFAKIRLEADSGNANPIMVGGPNVSSTDYGARLAANGVLDLDSGCLTNAISSENIFMVGVTTASLKMHVLLDER